MDYRPRFQLVWAVRILSQIWDGVFDTVFHGRVIVC